MAQVLKEESRELIMDAAKGEFLEHGFKGSSMRRIASKSKMTAGNLYRYFKNKEELLAVVVEPAYNAIDRIIRDLTNDTVSFRNREIDINSSQEELAEMIDRLSDALIDTHKKHKLELNILMMSSKLNDELLNWFSELISSLIGKKYGVRVDSPKVKLMSRGYAVSIFDGLKEILRPTDVAEEDLRTLTKIYLNSFLYMMNFDTAKYASAEH